MVETFVITCNDSVEHVFIGNAEDATIKMESLASKHYQQNKAHYQNLAHQYECQQPQNPYQYYRRHTNWVARDTPFDIGEGIMIQDTGNHDG